MKGRIRVAAATILCLLVVVAAFATELPVPPEGYQWAECPEINGAFLQPKGWHFKTLIKDGTTGYFITKENIDEKGSFITGLTVNVIQGIQAKKGTSPSEFAAEFIREGIISRKVVTEPWARSMGPFESFGVVLLNPDPDRGDYITHNLAIGNDATGTLYLIIFEGPAESWKTEWQVAEPMLQRFLIDSDI